MGTGSVELMGGGVEESVSAVVTLETNVRGGSSHGTI